MGQVAAGRATGNEFATRHEVRHALEAGFNCLQPALGLVAQDETNLDGATSMSLSKCATRANRI
eukprot:6230900-Lingulodinium_polyedra.AAC.1